MDAVRRRGVDISPGPGMAARDRTSEGGHRDLPMRRVVFLVFAPAVLVTVAYVVSGLALRDVLPSLLLLFILAATILFPIQLFVVLSATKREFGRFSLRSAFRDHRALPWWQVVGYGAVLWGWAGLMSVTVGPFEVALLAPVAERLSQLLPPYFDWGRTDLLQQYPRSVLLATGVVYLVLNGFVGPIVEELFFRGYLTSRLRRFGKLAPVIMTVLFSLYHLWLPLNNVFRIAAFLPAYYVAWKLRNIYIAMVFHCLSNLVSVAAFFAVINAMG
jgi:uncharacterized protein